MEDAGNITVVRQYNLTKGESMYRCTCAKNDEGEAICGLVAIAWSPAYDIPGGHRFYYCKKHVRMFVEHKWQKPSYFTLLPGKKMPTFDIPTSGKFLHDWHKINLMTISDESGLYDLLRCTKCGEEYKRFSLLFPSRAGCTKENT